MGYLPDEANWEGTTPQRRCQDLTAADILPDTHNVMLLRERALAFLKQLPISEFHDCKKLQYLVPPEQSPHPMKQLKYSSMMGNMHKWNKYYFGIYTFPKLPRDLPTFY